MTNTLAYYDSDLLAAVNVFVVLASEVQGLAKKKREVTFAGLDNFTHSKLNCDSTCFVQLITHN